VTEQGPDSRRIFPKSGVGAGLLSSMGRAEWGRRCGSRLTDQVLALVKSGLEAAA
jgi:hypothetical protein